MKSWKINESKRDPRTLIVIGPYDLDFINDIKRLRTRKWDGVLKAWKVDESERQALEAIIAEHSGPADEP